MNLNEFICETTEMLRVFEAWYRDEHDKDPKCYPLDIPDRHPIDSFDVRLHTWHMSRQMRLLDQESEQREEQE